MKDRFLQDPAGNSFSVVVLLGMLFSLVVTGYPPGSNVGNRQSGWCRSWC